MTARVGVLAVPTWMPDFIPEGVTPACREPGVDPEMFFPVHQEGPGRLPGPVVEAVKRICRRCPVQQACLDWAVESGERHGYWGGLGPEERANLRRRRELTS